LRGLEAFALLPEVGASASRNTSKPSSLNPFVPPGIGKTTQFFSGFDASWEIDLFGGALNAERAARADEDAARATLEAARQSVVAEVAQGYFSLRADQDRLRIATRIAEILAEQLDLSAKRLSLGRISEIEFSAAQTAASTGTAVVPQAEAAVTRDLARLATLTVSPLGELATELASPHPIPEMPELVTIGTPSAWLKRRPDVRAAEAQIVGALARARVERAAYFPRVTLLGGLGWTAQTANNIGRTAAEQWNYGPAISWSFLNIGQVHQRVKAADARADGALSAYEDTVLRALEETENALAGYRAANRAAATLAVAASAATHATLLATARLESGAIDRMTYLDAERSELTVRDQYVLADAQRATALAAVYKALAGDFAKAP
jgi:multidrug efflux system outer membrane protein